MSAAPLYKELLLLLQSVCSPLRVEAGTGCSVSSKETYWHPLRLTSPSSSTLAPLTWFHTSSHTLLHGRRFQPRGESSCDLAHLEDMFESQTQMKLPRMDNKGLVPPLFHWTALSAFHKLPFSSRTGLIAWTRIFHMLQLVMYEGHSSNLLSVLSWRCTATLSRTI